MCVMVSGSARARSLRRASLSMDPTRNSGTEGGRQTRQWGSESQGRNELRGDRASCGIDQHSRVNTKAKRTSSAGGRGASFVFSRGPSDQVAQPSGRVTIPQRTLESLRGAQVTAAAYGESHGVAPAQKRLHRMEQQRVVRMEGHRVCA